jgi:hypothetical protein
MGLIYNTQKDKNNQQLNGNGPTVAKNGSPLIGKPASGNASTKLATKPGEPARAPDFPVGPFSTLMDRYIVKNPMLSTFMDNAVVETNKIRYRFENGTLTEKYAQQDIQGIVDTNVQNASQQYTIKKIAEQELIAQERQAVANANLNPTGENLTPVENTYIPPASSTNTVSPNDEVGSYSDEDGEVLPAPTEAGMPVRPETEEVTDSFASLPGANGSATKTVTKEGQGQPGFFDNLVGNSEEEVEAAYGALASKKNAVQEKENAAGVVKLQDTYDIEEEAAIKADLAKNPKLSTSQKYKDRVAAAKEARRLREARAEAAAKAKALASKNAIPEHWTRGDGKRVGMDEKVPDWMSKPFKAAGAEIDYITTGQEVTNPDAKGEDLTKVKTREKDVSSTPAGTASEVDKNAAEVKKQKEAAAAAALVKSKGENWSNAGGGGPHGKDSDNGVVTVVKPAGQINESMDWMRAAGFEEEVVEKKEYDPYAGMNASTKKLVKEWDEQQAELADGKRVAEDTVDVQDEKDDWSLDMDFVKGIGFFLFGLAASGGNPFFAFQYANQGYAGEKAMTDRKAMLPRLLEDYSEPSALQYIATGDASKLVDLSTLEKADLAVKQQQVDLNKGMLANDKAALAHKVNLILGPDKIAEGKIAEIENTIAETKFYKETRPHAKVALVAKIALQKAKAKKALMSSDEGSSGAMTSTFSGRSIKSERRTNLIVNSAQGAAQAHNGMTSMAHLMDAYDPRSKGYKPENKGLKGELSNWSRSKMASPSGAYYSLTGEAGIDRWFFDSMGAYAEEAGLTDKQVTSLARIHTAQAGVIYPLITAMGLKDNPASYMQLYARFFDEQLGNEEDHIAKTFNLERTLELLHVSAGNFALNGPVLHPEERAVLVAGLGKMSGGVESYQYKRNPDGSLASGREKYYKLKKDMAETLGIPVEGNYSMEDIRNHILGTAGDERGWSKPDWYKEGDDVKALKAAGLSEEHISDYQKLSNEVRDEIAAEQ